MKVFFPGKKATIHIKLGRINPGDNEVPDIPVVHELIRIGFFKEIKRTYRIPYVIKDTIFSDDVTVDAVKILKKVKKRKQLKLKEK